jgi:hypothetical protein
VEHINLRFNVNLVHMNWRPVFPCAPVMVHRAIFRLILWKNRPRRPILRLLESNEIICQKQIVGGIHWHQRILIINKCGEIVGTDECHCQE